MTKKVKIGGSTLNVRYTKIPEENGMDFLGYIVHAKKKIQIDKTYPKETRNQTLLHECVHGIDREYSIGLSEQKTARLATALYAFLVDNKPFVREVIK